MKKSYFLLTSILLTLFLQSCKMRSYTADSIVCDDIIKEITPKNLLIGKNADISVADSLVAICDYRSVDSIVHLFNAKDYMYVKSFGKFGPGPKEILRPGQLAYDRDKKEFYIFDYGQHHVVAFELDSIMLDRDYSPVVKHKFSTKTAFPDRYVHINDTLGYARSITPGKTRGFTQGIGKFNLSKFEMSPFGNPEEKCYENRSLFSVSEQKGLLAEACSTQDLLLIYNFDGDLVARIEGPEFSNESDRNHTFFSGVEFAGNLIMCPYSGDKTGKEFYGSNLVIFDGNGKYVKTLNLGKKIVDLTYNPVRESVIFVFDDEMQIGEILIKDMINA